MEYDQTFADRGDAIGCIGKSAKVKARAAAAHGGGAIIGDDTALTVVHTPRLRREAVAQKHSCGECRCCGRSSRCRELCSHVSRKQP